MKIWFYEAIKSIQQSLDRIEANQKQQLVKENKMNEELEALKAQVTVIEGKGDSMAAMLAGFSAYVQAHLNDPAALKALTDSLSGEAASWQAAMDANPLPTDVPPAV